MYAIETVTQTAQFESLKGEWNALLAESRSDCIFLTWEWLFTRWKYFSQQRQLHIVTVRECNKLVAIAPLAIHGWQWRRLRPFSTLEFLGMDGVGSDYQDIIVHRNHEGNVISSLARHLANDGIIIELSRVIRATALARNLALHLQQIGWSSVDMAADVCPYIALSGKSWSTYLSGLGSEHRYNVQRRTRNLSKAGRVDIQQIGDESERREAMKLLINLHQMRWRERGGSGAFSNNSLLRFHGDFSQMALHRGWLRLYLLYIDGIPAAAWYGFHYKDVFYFYQSGFNTEFKKFSVGLVIMGHAIQRAIAEQAAIFDLLLGDERYKFLWACKEHELVRLGIYPRSVSGVIYRQLLDLRRCVKSKFWRYLPDAG